MAAAITCAPPGAGPVQSCRDCEGNQALRAEWGCDAPAAEPWNYVQPCPFCAGERRDCQACEGSNQWPLRDCPNRVVTRAELDLIGAAAMVEKGVLPDAGGWQAQAATFVEAFPFAAREISQWREVAMKRAQKDADAAAARRRRGR